jgi:class 3 adenylate cyclase
LPETQVIELCLAAASKGLLNMRWDLLCPNCRISKSFSTRMDDIPQGAHCATCNIDYQRNFNRNVELAFLPSKALRPLHSGEYCLFGPMSTPHIKMQLRCEPDATRTEANRLAPGHYRIRTLEPGNALLLDWAGGAFPQLRIDANHQLQLDAAPSQSVTLTIRNASNRPRTLIVEHRAWMQDVLTAHEATTLQCFRVLYHNEILRPGDCVEIDNVVLMFTDIKASTALYNTLGDAAAYALVREHFAILAGCVRNHQGSIVKTIGDAIMAAFSDPRDGVQCAFAIQQAFAAFNAERPASEFRVTVKLGMHMGPCIAVTLNGILDYYGKVANLTARLASLSEGGDLVLSDTLAGDAAVAALLSNHTTEQGSANVKGFADAVGHTRVTLAWE